MKLIGSLILALVAVVDAWGGDGRWLSCEEIANIKEIKVGGPPCFAPRHHHATDTPHQKNISVFAAFRTRPLNTLDASRAKKRTAFMDDWRMARAAAAWTFLSSHAKAMPAIHFGEI